MLSNDFSELWVVECVNKKVPTLRSRVAVCVCLSAICYGAIAILVICDGGRKGDVLFRFNNTAYTVVSGFMMRVNIV